MEDELADPYPDFDKLIAQAHLLLRSGQQALAERRLAQVISRLDRGEAEPFKPYEVLRLRATAAALALRGERAEALAALARWAEPNPAAAWYPLEHDPAFDAIRATPHFEALRARYRAHAASERAALEAMRERGEVPRRPARSAESPRQLGAAPRAAKPSAIASPSSSSSICSGSRYSTA